VGVYGTRGNYEGAYSLLRNKAVTLGADYVQVVRITEPHLAGPCFRNEYIINGIAYKFIGQAAPASRTSATSPQTARAPGLSGTYTGEITGNTQGRVFTMRITFTIVQSGDQIVGTWTTSGGTAGAVKGIIGETGIREWIARQVQPCAGEFGGVAVIEAGGDKLTGSYVGSDCNGSLTASFVVVRQ